MPIVAGFHLFYKRLFTYYFIRYLHLGFKSSWIVIYLMDGVYDKFQNHWCIVHIYNAHLREKEIAVAQKVTQKF